MKVDKSELKIVDSRKIGLVIKVVEEEYLQDALSGKLFFGSLGTYRDVENDKGDKVIGDMNEGQLFSRFKASKTIIKLINRRKNDSMIIEIPMDMQKENVTHRFKMNTDKNIGICSFTYLSLDDFKEYRYENDRTYFELRQSAMDDIDQFVKAKEKLTGHKCKIVVFKNEFWDCLHKSSNLDFDFVEYYDSKNPEEVIKLENSKKPMYFCKSNNYKSQGEFRVAKELGKESKGEIVNFKSKENIGIQVTLPELKKYVLIAEGLVKLD